jgi:FKBP-type peptidyl-prolyl cis-trans isomerase
MVTLYIENVDKSRTPSGWSTRKEDGAAIDNPFVFSPGVNLIEGWTQGVLQMKEGERALLHVPSSLGYGARSMGSPNGGGFYIPPNSDLLFDIEILGKKGDIEL